MSKRYRILVLVPVLAGMLLADAQSTSGCCRDRESVANEGDVSVSCCQAKTAEAPEQSCCSTAAPESDQQAGGLACCCSSNRKLSCGCQCRLPAEERAPPSRAPDQAGSGIAKLAATGVQLIVCDERPSSENGLSNWLKSSSIGSAFSVLYCRWRH